MSTFNGIVDIINNDNRLVASNASKGSNKEQINDVITEKPNYTEDNNIIIKTQENLKPFDINLFAKEVWKKSEDKNRAYAELTQNISAYDIAHNCIGNVVYKLNNTPVKSFAVKWLPIIMRSVIGTSIHDFIQGTTNQFTENEPSIKVPSIRFSGRIDSLIGHNILVEIKSCTYSDYEKIIKNQKPRIEDFYQSMVYKYILEYYLDECKLDGIERRTLPPKLDFYKIDTIQFIYVAHDLLASDVEDFGEMLERIKKLKQLLKSKSNSFFFMTALTINLTEEIAKPYLDFIHSKIEKINWYINNNKFPTSEDPFVQKKCFFCLYQDVCKIF